MAAELNCCASLPCPEQGSARCSRCRVVMYCGRECQTADWKTHKSTCKRIGKIGKAMCRLLSKHNCIIYPWGPYVCDLMEKEPAEGPVVYAEYDRDTREIRQIASTMNYAETLKEERVKSDGIFHSIVDLEFVIRQTGEGPRFLSSMEGIWESLLRIAPIGRDASVESYDMALLRAIEGTLTHFGSKTFSE